MVSPSWESHYSATESLFGPFFLTVLDCGGIREGKKYFVQKYVAAKVNDFRPINLIIGMYKIISKVFANGTSVVMSSSSISKPQNNFVKGR